MKAAMTGMILTMMTGMIPTTMTTETTMMTTEPVTAGRQSGCLRCFARQFAEEPPRAD